MIRDTAGNVDSDITTTSPMTVENETSSGTDVGVVSGSGVGPSKFRLDFDYSTSKKTPGGAGTHTGHTGHTGARGHTDHTDEPHNQPPKPKRTQTRTKTARITRTNLTTIHPNPTTQTRTKTATDSTAARTAASPESTAPRGRLRRGRPRRTRPCLHPLPERLPAPARRRSAK